MINFHKLDGLINCNDDWNFDGVVVDEIDNSNCCWWNKLWWMRLGWWGLGGWGRVVRSGSISLRKRPDSWKMMNNPDKIPAKHQDRVKSLSKRSCLFVTCSRSCKPGSDPCKYSKNGSPQLPQYWSKHFSKNW